METGIQEQQHPKVGEQAPDVVVTRASDGAEVALSELWKEGPALLVFLRHFG